MENSRIEWTTHTFNPWEGCAKVSPGCKNCYANSQHQLHHSSLKSQQGTCWGVNAPRLGKSEDNWKKPLKWNREAQAAGVRARVFCASMADVFEPQSVLSAAYVGQTAEVPAGPGRTRTVRFVDIAQERLRLLRLIYDTPHLDWLLLTKRPENILPALQEAKLAAAQAGMAEIVDFQVPPFYRWLVEWANYKQVPANVWLGTSVENQEQADARIPHLLAAPAAVRFLSCEPLLSAIDLRAAGALGQYTPPGPSSFAGRTSGGVDWVIVGGESGHGARPMHPQWAHGLRDQCTAAGVAFFFKQWGSWRPYWPTEAKPDGIGAKGRTDWHKWPGGVVSVKMDKHAAGRLLGGREWDEVPQRKEVAP